MKFDFCQFKNGTDSSASELFFYGDIVSDSWSAWTAEDQCPLNVAELLKEIGGSDIDIHINSGGGDVFAGMAIANMLRSCRGRKTVYIDGLAASIASVIAMAGDEIVIPSNAFMMIHKAWTVGSGNSDDMRKLSDTLDKLDSAICAEYMRNAAEGVTSDRFDEMMSEETWLTGIDAAELFKNITLADEVTAAASCNSAFMDRYSVPEAYNKLLRVKKPQNTNVPKNLEGLASFAKTMRSEFKL